MTLCKVVSYYRKDNKVWVRVRSGKIKSFIPTKSTEGRLRRVLFRLDRANRLGFSIATIFGGGFHCFIDPAWLQR